MTDKENDLISNVASERADAMWLSAITDGTAEQRMFQVETLRRLAVLLLANCMAQDIANIGANTDKPEKEVIEEVLQGNLQPLLNITMQTHAAIKGGEFKQIVLQLDNYQH